MKLLQHLFQFALVAGLAGVVNLRAQIYWDPAGVGGGVGGAGTWGATSFNTAADSTGTLVSSTASSADVFAGAAGGTITLSASQLAGSLVFNTTGYTLSVASGVALGTGAVTLGTGVTLTLSLNDAAATTLTLSSVSGGTNLVFGGTTLTASDALLAYVSTASIMSTPVIINTTSTSNTGGAAGFVFKAATTAISPVAATISATIANNSGVNTLLGTSTTTWASLVVNGVISGTSGVIIENSIAGGGKGTVFLNAQNTYTGQTLINNGSTGAVTLSVSNALPTGTDLIMGFAAGNGSLLNLNGQNQTIGSLMSGLGGGSITNSASGTISTLTINGSATATSAYAQVISNGAGTVALVRAGTGTTTLSAANTYTGGTTVSGGVLALTGTGTIGGATGAVTVSGGILDFTTTSQTVGAVTLAGGTIQSTGGSGTLTGTSYTVQSGTISAKLAGSGVVLTMAGPGTVTLAGANTYTGATIINGGTLRVNGSTSAASVVAVNSTGTLGGTGTVNGAVTVASGGAIAPGGATPGTLTIGSNLTLNGGSALNFRLGNSTADQLTLSGTGLTLTGPSSGQVTINLLNFNGTATLGTFTLLSVTGSVTSTTSWNLASFNLVTDSSLNGSYLSLGGNGYDLQVNAIPEPGTYAGIFGLLVLTGTTWFRRRRNSLTPLSAH